MKYRHLFFDLDHTLWDFETNSKSTLKELYRTLRLDERGIDDFDLFHKNYLRHNEHLWGQYRNGNIRQEELRIKRMRLALLDFKISDEELARQMSILFLDLLPTQNNLFPGTKEILQYLTRNNYHLHLITNGFEQTQHRKLHHSGLDIFFDKVITSEASGNLKPQKEIFEFALQKTSATLRESIMIGDSIEVDIQGAINAGMDQVFVNHHQIETKVQPTYEVSCLKELEEIF
jgi:putative hydrolase of the HAD superfamily